jgi:tetratricopeptide (TPR) repeat protein/TolB-like protein
MSLSSVFAELRRRRVFRVAGAYAAVAFIIAQTADIFLPGLGLPASSLRIVLALLILGFPVAIALAWAFDITPGGLTRTPERDDAVVGARARVGRVVMAGALAAATLAAAAFILLREQPPELARERVLVAQFDNHTGDPSLDPVGSMAADWIIQGLAHTGVVSVVPVTSALSASLFTAATLTGEDATVRTRMLAEETLAGIVVTGAYYQQGDSLYLRATVTDVGAGRVLHALEPIATPRGQPIDGIERLRQRVMSVLAIHVAPRMRDYATMPGFAPPAFEAYAEFAIGLEHFIASDWNGALPRFMEAAARDSAFATPLLYSGIASLNLNRYALLDTIIDRLRPRHRQLTAIDRAAFEFLAARQGGDHEAAYRASLRNPQLAPGTLAHWGLANAALAANRPRETIRISRQLDPERGELRGWLLYWSNLALAHHRLGENRAELKVARRARELHPDNPSAVFLEIQALAALGRVRQLHSLLDGVEDGPNAANLIHSAGMELLAHGQAEHGMALLRRALDLRLADTRDAPGLRLARADLHYRLGEWNEAGLLLHDLAPELPGAVTVQGTIAVLAARRGDVAEATRISDSLAALDRPYLFGGPAYQRARIAAVLGRNDEAVRLLEQAYREGFYLWTPLHREPDFAGLRDDPAFRALFRPRG